ncbi:hypothetical protein EV44_g4481 [Erysiphe necator]|uniref:Uncharacterized protein n=1 Tax=Uncinula necator TaxID=52586 RepID=A0A0B1NWL8_UNCNE|nr:hypothetical protein EV44_g4481 [Erysiphe necator]
MKRQNGSNESIQAKAKGRALIFGIFGFMVWTGTSVPMILGFSEFMLLLKTLLPAVGILIIIGIITIMPGYFVTQSQDTISTTDALSPYMGPASSSQNAAKVSAGSPSSAYMRGRSLYVVNPSSTPNDSPTPFGPSRGITKTNENTPQNSVVNINESNDSVPTFLTNAKLRENSTSDTIQSTSSYTPGYRGSSGIFPPQGNNQAALAPAIVGEIGPNPGTVNPTSTLPLIKRSILKWPLKSEKQSIRNLPISNPIYLDEKENDFESFVRMPTVELEQAIFNERQRRDAQAAKSNILSDASTRNSLTILRANLEPTTEINPANLKTTNIIVKSSSNEDKEIIFSASQIDEVVTASEINVNKDTKIASILTPYSPSYYAKKIPDYSYETSRATSILASPIPDELRRRSPMQKTNMKSPAKSTLILSPNRVTPPILDSQRLQQQEISVMKAENAMGSERIMLVNEIVYDRPDIVNNILKSVSGENSNILRGYPNMLEGNSDLLGPNKLDIEKPIYCTIKDEPELLPSVIDRPRPIQRRISRIISSGRRRSKSLGIIKSRATMTEAGTITLDPLPLPPPLPTRAANLKRLLQGDTSNMVHEEERLKYLFPAPPENQRLVNKLRRNLSLPNLAQMPSYKSLHNDIVSPDKPPNESMILDRLQNTSQSIDRDSEATSQMVSKISKKSSGVEDFGIFVSEKFDLTPRAPNSLNIIAISTEQQSTYNANLHNYQSSSNQTPNEDDTIDWDWLAELDPYETPVKKQSLTVNKTSVVNNMETQALNFDANSKDHEIVTVMLKTPVNDNDEGRRNQPPAIMFMPEENSRSISVNQKDKKSSSMKINQKVRRKLSEARDSWYCRIGERMPSFSGKRNEVFQTNKIPPPLILDRSKVEPIPEVRYSEPTPPYYPHESTNRALESQLSRMEEQEQNSIELLNEKIPINNAEIPLLESLEKEMEEQSNQWQNLQNNLDRESFISAISQLPTDSPRDSQKLITLGKINDICKHRVSNLSAISNNSDNISTDTWKKQLTEAQISYTNLYKQRSSYFKFSNFQISSPTPPESLNSETENNFESEDHNETPRPIRASISGNKNLLWRPAFPSNNNTSNIMWKPSNHSSANKDIIPPAADLRPPKRYTEQSLSIKSHSLWSKKAKNSNKTRSVSSWLSQTEIQPNYQNSEKMLNNFEPSDNIVDSYGKDNSFYSKLDDGYENMESLEDMEEIGDFNQYEEKFNESTLLTIAALLKTDNIPSDKSLLPLRQEIYSGTLIDDFPSQEFFPQDSVLPLTINQNFSTSQINNFQMYNLPTPTNIDYQGRESNNQFLEARESPKKISYIDALEEVSNR